MINDETDRFTYFFITYDGKQRPFLLMRYDRKSQVKEPSLNKVMIKEAFYEMNMLAF